MLEFLLKVCFFFFFSRHEKLIILLLGVNADLMRDVMIRLKRVVKPHNQCLYELIREVAISKPVFESEECRPATGFVTEEEFSKLELMLEGLVDENIFSKVDGGYTFHSNVERAYFLKN